MPTQQARNDRPVEVRLPEAGVVVMESRHSRKFVMPPMTHDYLKVLLVFYGKGELRGTRWFFPLGKEDLAVVPPGCEHWIVDYRPLSLYVLCFRPRDFTEGVRLLVGESGKPRVLPSAGRGLLEITRRLLHEQVASRPGGGLMARGLGWEILALLARSPAGRGPGKKGGADGSRGRVAAAAAELKLRFYEPLRLEEEAGRAGLGRRRFSDLFREVNGSTWWEALNSARLTHAERLLRETDRSVAAIAFESGYGDLSGFYRAWKARHGVKPQEWRERKKNGGQGFRTAREEVQKPFPPESDSRAQS